MRSRGGTARWRRRTRRERRDVREGKLSRRFGSRPMECDTRSVTLRVRELGGARATGARAAMRDVSGRVRVL